MEQTNFEPRHQMTFDLLQAHVRANATISMFRTCNEQGTAKIQDAVHVGPMVPHASYVLNTQGEMAELTFSQETEPKLLAASYSYVMGTPRRYKLRSWLQNICTITKPSLAI